MKWLLRAYASIDAPKNASHKTSSKLVTHTGAATNEVSLIPLEVCVEMIRRHLRSKLVY